MTWEFKDWDYKKYGDPAYGGGWKTYPSKYKCVQCSEEYDADINQKYASHVDYYGVRNNMFCNSCDPEQNWNTWIFTHVNKYQRAIGDSSMWPEAHPWRNLNVKMGQCIVPIQPFDSDKYWKYFKECNDPNKHLKDGLKSVIGFCIGFFLFVAVVTYLLGLKN